VTLHADTLEQPLVIPEQVRRGARRRRWLFVGVLGVVAAAAGAYAHVRSRPAPTQYRVTSVERRTVVQAVAATGHLDVTKRVAVSAPEHGRLIEVLVREGDAVKTGQPLARLDPRAAAIALHGAQATVAAAASRVLEAETAVKSATATRERVERLASKDLASPADLEVARAAESKARAALATARAERGATAESVRSAQLSQTLTTLRAPIDGVVLQAPTLLGVTLGPEKDAQFVVGTDLGTLRIDADVAEAEVGALRLGQAAQFSVPAFPGRSFDARVEHIGIDAERTAAAVRYPVELVANNPEHVLLPGMTATVTIEVRRAEDTLAVREAALRFLPEGSDGLPARGQVWAVTPSGLVRIRVSTGISDGAHTAIQPEPPAELPVGTRLALGVLSSATEKTTGPGIKLGKR
jgi:HlyD family secretion protein